MLGGLVRSCRGSTDLGRLEQRDHVLLAVEEIVVEVLHGVGAELVLEVGQVAIETLRRGQVGGAAVHHRDAAESAAEAAAGRRLVDGGAAAEIGAGEVAARVAELLVGQALPARRDRDARGLECLR